MKKLVLLSSAIAVCAVSANAETLEVVSYSGSALSSIAQKNISGLVSMANQTGDLKGDGQQHVVYHDGTTLVSYNYNAGSLDTSSYRVGAPVPTQIVTGGHIGSDAYNGDSVMTFDATGTARVYAGTGLQFSYYRGRTLGTDFVSFGFGNTTTAHAGDEMVGFYTANKKSYSYGATGTDSLTGYVISAYDHMWNGANVANLMDTDHINMTSSSATDNAMLGFDESGTYLVLQDSAGAYIRGRAGVNVDAGLSTEALFLQVGDVHSYANDGPEEGVIYRKDGSIQAWTATSSGFTTAVGAANIGTGVTEMLLGDVTGDGLEEVVVSKGDTIEVWSLASGSAVLTDSYTFSDTILDFSLGDMDGVGGQDIIAGVIPEPATLGLLGFAGCVAFVFRKLRLG